LLALNSTADDDDLESRTGILLESQRWPKDAAGFAVMPYMIKTSDYSKEKFTNLVEIFVMFLPCSRKPANFNKTCHGRH
jgi:hypothetical protein